MSSGVSACSQFDSAFDVEPQFPFIGVFVYFAEISWLFKQKPTTCFGSGCDRTHEHFLVHYFSFDQLCLSSPSHLC